MIDELRKTRSEIARTRDRFREIERDTNESVSLYLFNKYMEEGDVPHKVIQQYPFDEDIHMPVILRGSVVSKRITPIGEEPISMVTKWSSGATQRRHFHSDSREELLVVRGTIKVYTMDDEFIVPEGNGIVFRPGKVHLITALEQSETKQTYAYELTGGKDLQEP